MSDQKDLELAERGVEQVCYIRDDLASKMVREAAGAAAAEYPVQIISHGQLMVLLSNRGRLYGSNGDGNWEELPLPAFEP